MQLSQQERQILKVCVEELKSTLGNMQPKEADLKVALVANILNGFVIEKEEN